MAGINIFKKNFLKVSHLPTIMLIIGYVVYWVELYVLKPSDGVTSPLAWVLFGVTAIGVLCVASSKLTARLKAVKQEAAEQSFLTRMLVGAGVAVTFFILSCAFAASLLPVHLTQESDALTAHVTLPRQHLILQSFAHIPWSSYDLFYLPTQFALAPYWLVSEMPNKVPQVFFLFGIILVAFCLTRRLSANSSLAAVLTVFAIIGTHSIGVQMGTAMLDLVICYLFLAFLESLLSGAFLLAAIEFAFFVWAKPFVPIHTLIVTAVMVTLFFVLQKTGLVNRASWGFDAALSRLEGFKLQTFLLWFVVASVFIGGPFAAKATYYAGTPIYPIAPGTIKINTNINYDSTYWNSIKESSEVWLDRSRYEYGYGRSPIAFLKHFWLISVPDKGVNNRFDYPVGLMYLLFLVPFFVLFFNSLKSKVFGIIPFLIGVSYFFWWFGTQQTRYLYIPILLIYIVVLAQRKNLSKVLLSAMIVAMSLSGISVFRAHKGSFGLPPETIIRAKDRELLQLSEDYISENRTDFVQLDFIDAAYARFPVDVRKKHLPHILAY